MNYNEAMDYIQRVGNFGSNYGLDRTNKLLELLDSPQKKIKFIHIAGTNGKGSITSMVTSLLRGKGYKVGMYTSPYLEEFEERIQINGVNISKDILGNLMDKVKSAVDKVVEDGYSHPTEFEIITCLMFLYFYQENVDYGVIEVGLGGRLDSTNVIIPIVSIIASISFDHTNLLGNTLYEIASEKAGIIKKNVPVVVYPQEKEAYKAICNKAKEMESEIVDVDFNNGELLDILYEDRIYQYVKVNFAGRIVNLKLPLLGTHQINNLLVALKSYEIICKKENLEIVEDEVKSSIASVKWIGRLEVMNRNPLIVIDGAHNIQGIKGLAANVREYFKYKNIYLLLGILADKQVEDMVKEITPMAKKVYALTPHSDRAELASDLKKVIDKYNNDCIAIESYSEALDLAIKEVDKDDLILISGSLYMIGDMRKIIKKLL
ncbi:bifunctional folylpolyglutamate synthase/dihydrofolate synthase [Clostridium sp. SHJSY1]|uniref:bifunctional folylpolyglutamate synthase/dihydrofolate synthase n=1 Tax=Clostridium sp. SHJSY1 TaxID=2942483 RepID=UPI002875C55C|nr:folylpolyglutamate synthase/dihydrofolate synthase family protein [Clostridium sp. SHJSY1]MDS0527522.1 bifunctional folylpolyglutamate synthase/dihydrofolate synthase [Clostridium sp. SHJSY1]